MWEATVWGKFSWDRSGTLKSFENLSDAIKFSNNEMTCYDCNYAFATIVDLKKDNYYVIYHDEDGSLISEEDKLDQGEFYFGTLARKLADFWNEEAEKDYLLRWKNKI